MTPTSIAFYRRAVGYSLTGHTSEEVLFFAHGPTATGKSSKLEAIRGVLGDYAATADFETFLKRHGDAGIRNDVARLAGARLVISVEVDDGKALAEGLLKLLTGGDTVAARFLYRETFEFRPVFKLWLAANDRPRVNADDAAMWRRILQLPFVNVIPEAERDERVKLALRNDPAVQTAILAWAVQGLPRMATARPRRAGRRSRLHRRLPRRTRPTPRLARRLHRNRPSRLDDHRRTARELRAVVPKQRREAHHRQETRHPARRQRLRLRKVRRHTRKAGIRVN